ncbi:MAG: FAD-dependent oxidoreductase [Acidobacteriota bacterium]|nr:FAD-dependent oxidoreductase [Acidobacteriota bacterium]
MMSYHAVSVSRANTYDVAIIGAGVFGAWTALHLARRKQSVLLLDAYGPANARASSGGESRIIRMGYGADELYTHWAMRSLAQWKQVFAAASPSLFDETGVLWLASENDKRFGSTVSVLTQNKVPFELLIKSAIEKRYPQFSLHRVDAGILETHSGVLMARRAVATIVEEAIKHGVEYRLAHVSEPLSPSHDSSPARKTPGNNEQENRAQQTSSGDRLNAIAAGTGEHISARQFVFACGAWLPKLFSQILGARIFPTRQEIFFFGLPPGDARFAAPSFPTWLIQADEVYGMPDLESRGFKIGFDRHGERIDPDTQSRVVSPESAHLMRDYVSQRFPALRDAPIVETRVCQYENTSNGDFLIDRHPQLENVWFAGGGSGHGFKHGPALGEYVAQQLLDGGPAEPRFALATKATRQNRAVY